MILFKIEIKSSNKIGLLCDNKVEPINDALLKVNNCSLESLVCIYIL